MIKIKVFIDMEATKQTMTVELTEEQYVHIQQILKMDKPSRTRLTSTEKFLISNLLDSMIGELSSVHLKNEYGEPTNWEKQEYEEAQERIKQYQTIIKKLG